MANVQTFCIFVPKKRLKNENTSLTNEYTYSCPICPRGFGAFLHPVPGDLCHGVCRHCTDVQHPAARIADKARVHTFQESRRLQRSAGRAHHRGTGHGQRALAPPPAGLRGSGGALWWGNCQTLDTLHARRSCPVGVGSIPAAVRTREPSRPFSCSC